MVKTGNLSLLMILNKIISDVLARLDLAKICANFWHELMKIFLDFVLVLSLFELNKKQKIANLVLIFILKSVLRGSK